MIQSNSSSSFNSLSQNILFITPLLTHLTHMCGHGNMQNLPRCCIAQQCKNTDWERNNKKVAPNKQKMLLLSVFWRFSSNKSLRTPDFFLTVIKNNWIVLTALSWLGIIPRNVQIFASNKVYLFKVIYSEKRQFWTFKFKLNV